MANLTTLDLSGASNIGDAAAIAIAKSSHMSNLTVLALFAATSIGSTGARAIAASPNMKNLTTLSLGGTSIGNVGAKAIAESPYLDKLCSLSMPMLPDTMGGHTCEKLLERRFPFVHFVSISHPTRFV